MPPVLLIIFNRPDLVQRQCETLLKLPLDALFVVADGPREGTDDDEKCKQARDVVAATSWDCPVHTHYADANMGCANRIVSGLDWLFSRVDRAIILEDDCLAHPDFFRFCDELLTRYEHDEDIMQICGTNPLSTDDDAYSYRFSHHLMCWGWATWARAWARNDLAMDMSTDEIKSLLQKYLQGNKVAIDFWLMVIGKTRKGILDAWDYPWQLSVWKNGGSAILPNHNLIMNAGFRADATHTRDQQSAMANLPYQQMGFPLNHPPDMDYGYQYDIRFIESEPGRTRKKNPARKRGLLGRACSKVKRLLKIGEC